MRIRHNISAMNTNWNLNKSTGALKKNLERLSSGYRINRSADDAAGLAISERMRISIAGYEQGEKNISDGISLTNTADGAMQEIQEMLTRMVSLSTQAANGTLSEKETQYIQKEIDHLLQEITRIRNDTDFNGIPLFQGYDEVELDTNGNSTQLGDVPFGDFTLHDTNLGTNPFFSNSSGDSLALQAIVNNQNSSVYGTRFNMLYGNGSTSNSSLRMSYDGKTVIADFDNLTYKTTSGNILSSADPLCRTFEYTNADGVALEIRQKIHITENAAEKFYNIEYEFLNVGTVDVDAQFMFHADTAYNNNDRCEGYFINGQKVENIGIYTNSQDLINSGDVGTTPGSFSIINEDQALSFSEKIVLNGAVAPDLSIGIYSAIHNWSYYNSPASIGGTTDNQDLGFSLVWKLDDLNQSSASQAVQFQYGIVDVTQDNNLTNVAINKDQTSITQHRKQQQIWIQASAESEEDGLMITIGEISCELLGIDDADVTTAENADRTIRNVISAKNMISGIMSEVGAYHNCLEHMQARVNISRENLADAESQIRDTNMAEEMTAHVKNNILIQSAQAMLAQSNQAPQQVLQLLQ